MKNSFSIFVLVTAWGLVSPQVNSINSIPGSGQTQFFLDRYSDCDGKPREIGQATASISSFSTETQGKPVTSCTLTLNTENIREPYRFKLEFLAVRIGDPLTQIYVYDGQSGSRLLWSFSQIQNKPNDLVYDFTTGQMVTFRFSRGEFDKNYDIRIVATPVPSSVNCNYENEYNCNVYGYVHRILGLKEIAVIIAACVGVVLLIVIVIICCFYKQHGVTRKWNEDKLGNANISNSRRTLPSVMSTIPKGTSEHSHHRKHDPYEDDNYSDKSSSSDKRYSEESYSAKNYSEKSFSEKNYCVKNYRPPMYREAVRHKSESVSSVDECSFVQADDAHPQSVFIEHVITPRVNKKTNKSAQIPVDVDDTYDCNESKRKGSKVLMVDKGADPEHGEIEESDTDNETEDKETEVEESETEALNKQTTDQTDALYSNPDTTSQSVHNLVGPPKNTGAFRPLNPLTPQMHMSQFQQVTPNHGMLLTGVQHPQYGFTGQPISYQQGHFSFPQDQYPQIAHGCIPQNNWPQPTSYNQASFSLSLQQEQSAVVSQYNPHTQQQLHDHEWLHKSKRNAPSLAQASNIPVYSHLVNRGYRPVDGRYSPASNSTGTSNISRASNLSGDTNVHNEDLDSTANLSSGVELLKRNN